MIPNKTILSGECSILLNIHNNWKRLGKLFFLKDNSICYSFPNILKGGILAESECSRMTTDMQKIDITKNGKVTKEIVKFTYHSDGDVHFSMDGKIYTRIRLKSEPLGDEAKHLFSCQYVNFSNIENLSLKEYERYCKKGCLRIHLVNEILPAYNISVNFSPRNMINLDEYQRANYVIMLSHDHQFAIKVYVTPHEFNIESKDPNEINLTTPMVFFSGGFVIEETKIRFLSAMYPVGAFENMLKTLGTVDRNNNFKRNMYQT